MGGSNIASFSFRLRLGEVAIPFISHPTLTIVQLRTRFSVSGAVWASDTMVAFGLDETQWEIVCF